MKWTTRRDLLKVAATGTLATGFGPSVAAANAQDAHSAHERPPEGPLATATVSFGAWPADSTNPLDRYPTSSPGGRNVHLLIPNEPTIRAGGSINFVISGFHLVAIYDDGHEPEDIDEDLLETGTQFISDANRRIYRGLSPAALAYVPAGAGLPNLAVRDRVEVVQFPHPGRYLVICAFRPHFLDNMVGYVNVIP